MGEKRVFRDASELLDPKAIPLSRAVFCCVLVFFLALALGPENIELFIFLTQERKEKGFSANHLEFFGEG